MSNKQVCKFASLQVCRCAGLQVCRCAGLQVTEAICDMRYAIRDTRYAIRDMRCARGGHSSPPQKGQHEAAQADEGAVEGEGVEGAAL